VINKNFFFFTTHIQLISLAGEPKKEKTKHQRNCEGVMPPPLIKDYQGLPQDYRRNDLSQPPNYNYANDLYCLNSNVQPTNQYYSNYHEQVMHHHHHHQYFDEGHHYVSYGAPPVDSFPTFNEQIQQESFPIPQSNNDLYEFLPEEIFQLDQPIVKNESLVQNSNTYATIDASSQLNYAVNNNAQINGNHCFLDLGARTNTQTNALKYHTSESYSEINNNSANNNGVSTSKDMFNYSHIHQVTLSNCAVEDEKMRNQIIKLNQSNFQLFDATKSNLDMYRQIEKY
jgi:hypothetical protein